MKQYHSFLVHRYCKHGCPPFSLERLKLLPLWRKQMVLWFFVIRVKKKEKNEESVIPLVFLALLFKTTPTKMTVPFFTNKKRSIILENRRRIETHYCYRLDPMLLLFSISLGTNNRPLRKWKDNLCKILWEKQIAFWGTWKSKIRSSFQ